MTQLYTVYLYSSEKEQCLNWLQIIVLSPSLAFPCNQESGCTVVCWQIGSCYEDNEGIKLLCTPSPWKQRGSCRQRLPGFYLCLHVCVICEQTSPRAWQPRQGGSSHPLLVLHWPPGCALVSLPGGDHGKQPQPLKGFFFLQHPWRCSRLFCESLHEYQNHSVMLGQHFWALGHSAFQEQSLKQQISKAFNQGAEQGHLQQKQNTLVGSQSFWTLALEFFLPLFPFLPAKEGFNSVFVEVPGTQVAKDSRDKNISILSCYY